MTSELQSEQESVCRALKSADDPYVATFGHLTNSHADSCRSTYITPYRAMTMEREVPKKIGTR